MAGNKTTTAAAGSPDAAKSSSSGKSKDPSRLTHAYLVVYNVAQVLGWSYLLYQLTAYYTFDRSTDKTLWEYLGTTLLIFQNAALLEIVHAATGAVKSNVVLTTFQVFSRVIVVCAVLLATPTAIYSPGLPMALLAWSVTEIIRYGFYTFNLVGFGVPGALVYLRYTTFIALYPIGVTGELLCFYWAQAYARDHTVWSAELPNAANATFSYYYFLWTVMLLYVPLFPQLYLHMFALRRKVLGGGGGGAAKAKRN